MKKKSQRGKFASKNKKVRAAEAKKNLTNKDDGYQELPNTPKRTFTVDSFVCFKYGRKSTLWCQVFCDVRIATFFFDEELYKKSLLVLFLRGFFFCCGNGYYETMIFFLC